MRIASRRPLPLALLASATLLTASSAAFATNGFEFPDNGTEQMGRGGAWVARASNPLATYFNPAGLAGQPTAAIVNVSLIWQRSCFRRFGLDGQPEKFEQDRYQYPDQVCNTDSGTPFPNPQIAFNYRVTDKLGIGIAVVGPSARGKFSYPQVVDGTYFFAGSEPRSQVVPAPQRYLLVEQNIILAWPQIGVGYEAMKNLRVGASFIWGIASLEFKTHAVAMADTTATRDKGVGGDLAAEISVKDWFVPGFTTGALWSPLSWLDVGGWLHWSDKIRATGDVTITGPIYGTDAKPSPAGNVTSDSHAGAATVNTPQPMSARVGARYHRPRGGETKDAAAAPPPDGTPQMRDPIANDVFDVELDLTWANNSQFDRLEVLFPAGTYASVGPAGKQVGMELPQDSSVWHGWKDVFGVRLGGDWVVLADRLSVRAGGFFQTEGQNPAYLHLDYIPSQMVGLNAGGTVRFGPVDAMLGYGHVFYKGLDNGGAGSGPSLAGTPPYRTANAVNNGANSSSVNVLSLGAACRF
jgi:long-chain fatty acid transport protein